MAHILSLKIETITIIKTVIVKLFCMYTTEENLAP